MNPAKQIIPDTSPEFKLTPQQQQKFWSMVSKTESCWLWKGSMAGSGYGAFTLNTRYLSAHRISWVLANGAIPNGLLVCHHCDNPPCVNPAHLFIGTRFDNTRDMLSKGRGRALKGEAHPKAKLVEVEVLAIRKLYASRTHSQRSLARMFGVSDRNIRHIVHGNSWTFLK